VQQNVAVSKASGVGEFLSLSTHMQALKPHCPHPLFVFGSKDYYERNSSAFETRHPALGC
jgi:hypothetical protein